MPKNKTKRSANEVERCVSFWVEKLNLTDWKFNLGKVDKEYTRKTNSMAYCEINEQHKECAIFLKSLTAYSIELEFCIVHELLHVVFWNTTVRHYKKKEEIDLFEQAINATAESLVTLRHGK